MENQGTIVDRLGLGNAIRRLKARPIGHGDIAIAAEINNTILKDSPEKIGHMSIWRWWKKHKDDIIPDLVFRDRLMVVSEAIPSGTAVAIMILLQNYIVYRSNALYHKADNRPLTNKDIQEITKSKQEDIDRTMAELVECRVFAMVQGVYFANPYVYYPGYPVSDELQEMFKGAFDNLD